MAEYGFEGAADALGGCTAKKTPAKRFYRALGLVAVHEYRGPLKFQDPIVMEMYRSVKKSSTALASRYSKEELQSQLWRPDFIEEISKPILEVHGHNVFGAHIIRQEGPISPGCIPPRPDISNDQDYTKIRVLLCCWTVNTAARRIRNDAQKQRQLSAIVSCSPAELESSGGRTMRDYQRVEHPWPVPDDSDSVLGQELDGSDAIDPVQRSLDTARTPGHTQIEGEPSQDAASSSHSFHAPTAPMITENTSMYASSRMQGPPTKPPLASTDPLLSQNPVSQPINAGEIFNSDEVVDFDDEENVGDLLDDKARDPDFTPGNRQRKSKKRRRTKATDQLTKLSKVRKTSSNANPARIQHDSECSGPSSPLDFPQRQGSQRRATPDTETFRNLSCGPSAVYGSDEETGDYGDGLNFPNLSVSETRPTTSPRTTPAPVAAPEHIEHGEIGRESNNKDPSLAPGPDTSQLDVHKGELNLLLLSYFVSPEETDRTEKSFTRLIELLETVSAAEDSTLKRELGESYAHCKSSFQKWVEMLSEINRFRECNKYTGLPGADWEDHCRRLPNLNKLKAAQAEGRLKLWMKKLRCEDRSFDIIESLRSDLVLVLCHLAEMPAYLPAEVLVEPFLAYNKSLLGWFS